ncbi:MAG: hypothetical protein EAS51_10160 [Microbacteriaceae bacterium]|nr:MAG: hypothetical protein EAS51_10160 [Microbacteriaceae bacterium]
MKLYADFAPRRVRQIVADLSALVVIALAIAAGVTVHGVIAAFGAAFGRLEDAGTGFQDTMGELGESLSGVPLLGDGVRGILDSAAGAGGSLADAGRTGQAVIESIAVGAGLGVAALPIAIVLLVWLLPRVRFVLRARTTRALFALQDGPSLLALRALDDATAKELARISPRPVRAWLSQDADVVHRLAELEAREAGIRLEGRGAGAGAQPA